MTDQKAVQTFTDLFSYVLPGESRDFEHAQLKEAIDWASKKFS